MGLGLGTTAPLQFFYFFIFQFRYLQKYIFIFEIYRNIPRPPCCRAAGTWSLRQGLFCKKFHGNFALKPLEDRSPDSGAAGPPGRPAAGRPPPRGRRPSFASPKIQKKILGLS